MFLLYFNPDHFDPYLLGLLYWHCGKYMITQVPVKQPWRILIIHNRNPLQVDNKTPTTQSTTKLRRYFMGYTVRNCILGLVQNCGNSIANALELPQSCTKPSVLCCIKTVVDFLVSQHHFRAGKWAWSIVKDSQGLNRSPNRTNDKFLRDHNMLK